MVAHGGLFSYASTTIFDSARDGMMRWWEPPPGPAEVERNGMKYLISVVAAALVIVLATFGIQNPFPITIQFLQFQSAAVPLYLVVLLAALIGVLVSALLGIPGRVQRQFELRRLRQEVAEQVSLIAELRSRLPSPVMQPLADERTR
jgi:uncharacterized integral membrane protein